MTDKMHINWDMIVRKILEESSVEEDMLVENWLEEDEENREYYRKAKHYFDVYYTGEETRNVDTESAWGEFVTYVDKSSSRFLWRKLAGYAAAIVILVGMGVTYWLSRTPNKEQVTVAKSLPVEPGMMKAVLVFNSGERVVLTDTSVLEQVVEEYGSKNNMNASGEEDVEFNTVFVPRGGEYSLVLADGTRVKMNADSKLSFPKRFAGKDRRVRLEGEALFNVTKDSVHSFIVETGHGEVKVLGTEFNLNAYPDNQFVQTTLVSGKVAFKGEGMAETQVILPGEQIVYDIETRAADVKKVDTRIYTAWSEGKWIIEGQRLEDIMKQLSRWYDVEILYQNPVAKDLIFTGDLEKYRDCEVVLNIIAMTTNVVFEMKDKVITIKMK